MDSALPTLVSRLPDRRALTRLVSAALRHEVVAVALAEPPRSGQPHALHLRVNDAQALALVAEPTGPPQNGHFPLRLRPFHRAQAAELYALLEAENVESSSPLDAPPDTVATPPTFGADSAPIARAMSGSAPPPAAPFDPKKTAPSSAFASQVSTQPKGPAGAWSRTQPLARPSTVPIEIPKRSLPADREGGTIALGVKSFAQEPVPSTASAVAPPSSNDRTMFDASPSHGFFDTTLGNLPVPETAEDLETARTDPPSAVPDSDEDQTLVKPPDAKGGGGPVRPAAGRPAEEDTLTKDVPFSGGPKKKTTRSSLSKKPSSLRGDRRAASSSLANADDGNANADTPSSSQRIEEETQIGRRIADGKYVLESLIGSGAAGAVYKATHRELRRTVAIKVLHRHYQDDPHFMRSFEGEARAASQIDHPNVMRVLDFGREPDGLFYIVMEYLSGRTLQSVLDEERRLAPDRAMEIMVQVCAALSVAHDNGIIHRDIKPDNIMLVTSRDDEGGTFELVKVCDFGIAALQNPGADEEELGVAKAGIAGTPEYMSPEQARGGNIDARSDVYACGICLYELVTGRPPFLGENAVEILMKGIEEAPRPPSQLVKGLDAILEEIILRAIAKTPEKRHQSAREMRLELKELIDPTGRSDDDDDGERSLVENVPVLDDPASGFSGFFLAIASAVLRVGRFERAHPEAPNAMKELLKATKTALRGRIELTFARRNSQSSVGFCVMSGMAEIVDLKRLLGSQLYASIGRPFLEAIVAKGVASFTLREGIPDVELTGFIEVLLGPLQNEELRREMMAKPARFVSVLFVSDVLGRDRKLSWKVGLCTSRLARDLVALSNLRGISLKKTREMREDLVSGIARLLNRAEDGRQFLYNVSLVDDAVQNLRGFSAFQTAPLIVEKMIHDACADTAILMLQDFDGSEIPSDIVKGYLRLLSDRLLSERSPKSDMAVTELHRRSLLRDDELPRDLSESIRAQALADALSREPAQFLRALDMIGDADDYAKELTTLEAAMAVLARRGDAAALVATVGVLARHAKPSGPTRSPREAHAEKTLKVLIDKQRLVPIANVAMKGPAHQQEAARRLLVHAGSAGTHALYIAREGLVDPAARSAFVKVFKDTGPAGWSLLAALLPRLEARDEAEILLVEDLLRAVPERLDPVLGDAVAKFLTHPRLRAAALTAIVPLWGERAKKALLDALEFADDPARIVAMNELRRLRAIDDPVVGVLERLLSARSLGTDELRATAAAALVDANAPLRGRVVAFLAKALEGKRGLVAMLRGDGDNDAAIVLEAMARSLLTLDRNEGIRAVKERMKRVDGTLHARLGALLQQY